jgi:hypothetical protein
MRCFHRLAQDTEFIEVQGQPLPTGGQAEPLGFTRGLEFVERQPRPSGRGVEGLTSYVMLG